MKKAPDAVRSALNWKARDNNNDNDLIFFARVIVILTIYNDGDGGADRMCDAVEEMTGQRPWLLFKLCWCYITPLICLVSDTMSILVILVSATIGHSFGLLSQYARCMGGASIKRSVSNWTCSLLSIVPPSG